MVTINGFEITRRENTEETELELESVRITLKRLEVDFTNGAINEKEYRNGAKPFLQKEMESKRLLNFSTKVRPGEFDAERQGK